MTRSSLSFLAASAYVVLFVPISCFSATLQRSAGPCGPNVIGDNNFIVCNFVPGIQKPQTKSALNQIRVANESSIYDIDSLEYVNGYQDGNNEYIVQTDMSVTLTRPCNGGVRHNSEGGRANNTDDVAINAVSDLILFFAMIKLFGQDCKAGGEYIIHLHSSFRLTEKGWMLTGTEIGQ